MNNLEDKNKPSIQQSAICTIKTRNVWRICFTVKLNNHKKTTTLYKFPYFCRWLCSLAVTQNKCSKIRSAHSVLQQNSGFIKAGSSSLTCSILLLSSPLIHKSLLLTWCICIKELHDLPIQHWGGLFSTPSVKLDPDILESWNFQGWYLSKSLWCFDFPSCQTKFFETTEKKINFQPKMWPF